MFIVQTWGRWFSHQTLCKKVKRISQNVELFFNLVQHAANTSHSQKFVNLYFVSWSSLSWDEQPCWSNHVLFRCSSAGGKKNSIVHCDQDFPVYMSLCSAYSTQTSSSFIDDLFQKTCLKILNLSLMIQESFYSSWSGRCLMSLTTGAFSISTCCLLWCTSCVNLTNVSMGIGTKERWKLHQTPNIEYIQQNIYKSEKFKCEKWKKFI